MNFESVLKRLRNRCGKDKNWILHQALREYLDREDSLAVRARRQSLLAGKQTNADEEYWGSRTDSRDWI